MMFTEIANDSLELKIEFSHAGQAEMAALVPGAKYRLDTTEVSYVARDQYEMYKVMRAMLNTLLQRSSGKNGCKKRRQLIGPPSFFFVFHKIKSAEPSHRDQDRAESGFSNQTGSATCP